MDKSKECTECKDKGYGLFDVDSKGILEIQRCDTCEYFASDKEAKEFVEEQKLVKAIDYALTIWAGYMGDLGTWDTEDENAYETLAVWIEDKREIIEDKEEA